MLTIYHRPGAGRPIRLVWALEEAGADYDLVVITPEACLAWAGVFTVLATVLVLRWRRRAEE